MQGASIVLCFDLLTAKEANADPLLDHWFSRMSRIETRRELVGRGLDALGGIAKSIVVDRAQVTGDPCVEVGV